MIRVIPFLLKPLLRGAIELLFYAPIWLALAIYTLTPNVLIIWGLLLLIVYCIPQYIWYSGKSMRYGVRLLLVLMFGIAPTVLLAGITELSIWALLACCFVGIVFAASSFRSLAHSWHNSFSSVIMTVMIIAALAVQFLKVIVLHELVAYNSVFFSLGIAACILYLFIQNERTIRDQQMIDGASATIRRSVAMNRIYITCITLFVAAIAIFRTAQQQIEQWVKQFFAWLFRERAQGDAPPPEQTPPPQQEGMGDMLPQGETAKFWIILEKIIQWTFTALIIAAVFVGIYYFVTKIVPKLIKLLQQILNQRSLLQQTNEGYQDEIEGIVPEKSDSRRQKRQSTKHASLKHWRKLNGIDKLKVLFVHTLADGLRRGEPIKVSNTAKQNLNLLMKDKPSTDVYGDLLRQYDNMRYGKLEPDEGKLQQLREQIEALHSKQLQGDKKP